jgi:hypothetical protein
VIQGLQPRYTFKSCRWKTPREVLRGGQAFLINLENNNTKSQL